MERVISLGLFCKSKSPLEKGEGAEGAGVVMIFEDRSKMLIARDKDLLSLGLILGFPVFQDNPQDGYAVAPFD